MKYKCEVKKQKERVSGPQDDIAHAQSMQ